MVRYLRGDTCNNIKPLELQHRMRWTVQKYEMSEIIISLFPSNGSRSIILGNLEQALQKKNVRIVIYIYNSE